MPCLHRESSNLFPEGQKGKTTVAATEVSGSLVMNQGPVRLLGLLLL